MTRQYRLISLLIIVALLLLPHSSSALSPTTELVTAIQLPTGTLITGDLASTQSVDGTNYQVEEVIETPAFDIILIFTTSADSILSLNLYGYYEGNPAHNVEGQFYDWVNGDWDVVYIYPDAGSDTWYNVTIGSSNYISGEQVRLRIIHTSSGSAGHDFYLDYVEIVTSSSTDDSSLLYQLFLSTNLWGWFGPIGILVVTFLILTNRKLKPLGFVFILLQLLITSQYFLLVSVTPWYWWNIIILVLGMLLCIGQMAR